MPRPLEVGPRAATNPPPALQDSSANPYDSVQVADGFLLLRDYAAREDAPSEFARCALNSLMLPASPFTDGPTTLAEHPELLDAVVTCLRGLARRTSKGKSKHIHLKNSLRSLVKVLEFGWLRGLYAVADWSRSDFEDLAELLGKGGWTLALDLENRTRAYCQTATLSELRLHIKESHAKSGGYSISDSFGLALGTNCAHQELIRAKEIVVSRLDLPNRLIAPQRVKRAKQRSDIAGMSRSQIRQDMSAMNLLGECLEGDRGLGFIPFPNTVKASIDHGRDGMRTGNLGPDTVAALLKESLWWITVMASPVTELVRELFAAAKKDKCLPSPKRLSNLVQKSVHAQLIQDRLHVPLKTMGLRHAEGETSLSRVIYTLYSACFVVIAFLNARRKDELEHKKIGLHRTALQLVDADLDLYECEFYIEKTYKEYVTFYVGSATRTAIQVLEELSDLARSIDEFVSPSRSRATSRREDKVFQMPRFLTGARKNGVQWYSFNASSSGLARDLLDRALGSDSSIHVHPHMFRRAYALIHHYRFENGTLLGLSQQLGHKDLESTLTYVTDSPSGSLSESTAASYARRPLSPTHTNEHILSELAAEINSVGIERVQELAREVVDGSFKSFGGFARVVRRMHQLLSKRFDYSCMDHEQRAHALSEPFINRGHLFRPMKHANCIASASRRSKSAGCFSERLGRNSPESSSAMTCTRCPFSHFTQAHMKLWQSDAVDLDADADRLGADSLAGMRSKAQAANIRRVIELVSIRTGMSVGGKHGEEG